MAGEEEFQIRTGMNVIDENDKSVGTLEGIFSEDETNISRFIQVGGHLLPVETIDTVEGDRLKLVVDKDKMDEFPTQPQDALPSPEDQQKAYEAIGLSGPLTEEGGPGA